MNPKQVTDTDNLRKAFGESLLALAATRDFYVVDCDIASGTMVTGFRDTYPDRFVQAGTAEQNAMGLSAGLSIATNIPVVLPLFAVFGARGWEQYRLSVAYNRANVKLCLSHPGVQAGEDGFSAMSLSHYALWRTLPGVTVVHPADQLEMRQTVGVMLDTRGPWVLFTGRSPQRRVLSDNYNFEPGKAKVIYDGNGFVDANIIATGVMVGRAIEAAKRLKVDGIKASVINLSTHKPLDISGIVACAETAKIIVTAEDHSIQGGLFEMIAGVVSRYCPVPVIPIAVMDIFGESGSPDGLAEHFGLTADDIVRKVKRAL